MGKEYKDSEKRRLFVTHAGELLFWLIIVLIIVVFFSVSSILSERMEENDYQIFLPDVDGLIVGSPVRMMGVEVGHVTKIKPVNDNVYVKFLLTSPDVYIPQGTQVTVEFSGMAGSKSLELYLPDKDTYIDSTTPLIEVLPPKRLLESVGLLSDMYKKFVSIIYTSSSFGKKLEGINVHSEKDVNIDKIIERSGEVIDKSKSISGSLQKIFNGVNDNE